MRILLVSQMYPSAAAPSLGTFVAALERELEVRGHELARAVVDRRGARWRHLSLARDVARTASRFRPDVVYGHFLVPAGLLGVLAGRAPAVLTAHGQDVENARRSALVRGATRLAVRRAHGVIAVSDWLRQRLEEVIPEARGRTEVIDCGVDLERFAPGDQAEARRAVEWMPDGTGFLCVGSLSERKNVVRLGRALGRHVEGSLLFVGDGPLDETLAGMSRVEVRRPVPHARVADFVRAADVVCQPSLVEPFGLATLEAMACARSVVATSVGGPPEFVTPGSGVLVDPEDEQALVAALGTAAALPRPNLEARAAAEPYDIRVKATRVETLLEHAAGATAGAAAPRIDS